MIMRTIVLYRTFTQRVAAPGILPYSGISPSLDKSRYTVYRRPSSAMATLRLLLPTVGALGEDYGH